MNLRTVLMTAGEVASYDLDTRFRVNPASDCKRRVVWYTSARWTRTGYNVVLSRLEGVGEVSEWRFKQYNRQIPPETLLLVELNKTASIQLEGYKPHENN